MLRRLYYLLPPAWRFVARRLYYLPTDLWATITNARDPLTPPRGLIYTGSGDFRAQGEKMLQFFVQQGGLQAHHAVLDVGSGIGRMAAPLTRYLNTQGQYEGFDVVALGVRWCQKHISTRFPNFRFRYVPLNNDLYRANGADAGQFRFPYADATFDFTMVISVFTHLLPAAAENYLHEIARTLRPGGVCVATFFIWNHTAAQGNHPTFDFPFDHGHYRLMDAKVQSANVAFDEAWLQEKVCSARLHLQAIHYGYWCGRNKEQTTDFQDIIIIKKPHKPL